MAKFVSDYFTCDMTPRWVVFELPHCEGHRPTGEPAVFETKPVAKAWVKRQRRICSNLTLRFHIYKLVDRKNV